MYDEILVPTDGSPEAEAAVEHAVDIAATYGARIHALYVVDTSPYATLDATETVVEDLEDEGEDAVEYVTTAAADAGVEARSTITNGNVHEAITTYARANDIDLIVMGTHGRRGLGRVLVGSVTERVVRTADVPVLTVRSG
ncbi:nucleotide-binding universal stress UspA family protein [Halarchaeum rubridurum]|uniref:Nucleotide-binding universal stress UspA family protein n=1 Tax=Halarchaeum rubridurum TaxID=489911 RepID=A0A830FYH0_9EURY|nr:universal stress protein [Halarchaeum rubridurum]MBP1954496.1 nucleotide-binding universal stress UspA family protein [Halarchaeum rubridurum]GGM61507.1 universal stress protein UspA [Halarchaeum rubridurum]